jgi:ribosomal-protein-alanine N-acetyltransferase
MSNLGSVAIPNLTLRWLMQRDLPKVLQIQEQAPIPAWNQQDFLTVLQSFDTTGWVAEIDDRIAGFLIYMINSDTECKNPAHRSRWEGANVGKPLSITLLNLGVAPRWHRQGLGSSLLYRLCRKLRHADDCIQAVVPEANLPMQLLLRESGFKAVRIERGYYDHEDGYLMERRGQAAGVF